MHVNKRFKNKTKTNSRHIQIDNLAHKKCSGFIKGWHHCLKSESKESFLVNNHSSVHPPPFFKGGKGVNFNYIRRSREYEKLKNGGWKVEVW